jgi:hypothetical protein
MPTRGRPRVSMAPIRSRVAEHYFFGSLNASTW